MSVSDALQLILMACGLLVALIKLVVELIEKISKKK